MRPTVKRWLRLPGALLGACAAMGCVESTSPDDPGTRFGAGRDAAGGETSRAEPPEASPGEGREHHDATPRDGGASPDAPAVSVEASAPEASDRATPEGGASADGGAALGCSRPGSRFSTGPPLHAF